jgi:YfiH family protein
MPDGLSLGIQRVEKPAIGRPSRLLICSLCSNGFAKVTEDKTSAGHLSFISPGWEAPSNVRAVTSTRLGGSSSTCFMGLNVGQQVGDKDKTVDANRLDLQTALGLERQPVWMKQVHGTRVIDPALCDGEEWEADGAITGQANTACAVMTADCLPLFLAAADGSRVGLLHVGWRGLATGIVEAGLRQMGLPADQLLAWSGPAIGPNRFEIGEEVRRKLGGPADCYEPSPRNGHFLANLYGLVNERLHSAGIGFHGWDGYCTYEDEELFYSYRRDGLTGRMVSLIWRDT